MPPREGAEVAETLFASPAMADVFSGAAHLRAMLQAVAVAQAGELRAAIATSTLLVLEAARLANAERLAEFN